jgi:hypothetical protein
MVMLAEEHLLLSNTIEKFPFATDTNATDIGDLSVQDHIYQVNLH